MIMKNSKKLNNKFQSPRPSFKHLVGAEHFPKNRRAARDHYGKYMDKLLEVTGGRVIYDYEEFNKSK